MERRPLGQTGLEVSAIAFGCGAVGGLMVRGDRREQVRAIALAMEAGINYYDTAPSYGDGASETNLGIALRELGVRDQVIVGTKVRLDPPELNRPEAAIRESLQRSLDRLGLERVELLHLHNAIVLEDRPDGSVPVRAAIDEAAGGLRRVVEEGLAQHAGFTAVGDTEAIKELSADPAYETAQAYLNVLNPSGVRPGAARGQQDFDGFITHAAGQGKGVIAIRIYAAGALTARPVRHANAGLPPRALIPGGDYGADVESARHLEAVAAELGLESVLELGLRFALSAPGVATALFGMSTIDHVETAIRWADRGRLPADQFEHLLELAATRA
jgi:L-galactose dehydrogenase/L-glyceraldehyde 3-phosphate reductase